jgi:hypothetical protein
MVTGRVRVAGTLGPMSLSSVSVPSVSLSNLVVVAQEQTRELPMSPYAFGAIAFVSFLALLGVLWGFRGTAQKLAAGHVTHGSGHQQDGHGATDHQGSHH